MPRLTRAVCSRPVENYWYKELTPCEEILETLLRVSSPDNRTGFSQESLSTSSESFCKHSLVALRCVIIIKFFFLFFFLGLSHFPRSEKAEISFNMSDNKTYETYTTSITKFLEPYNETTQMDQLNYESCGGKYESKKTNILLPQKPFVSAVCLHQVHTSSWVPPRTQHALLLVSICVSCVVRRRSSDVHWARKLGE